MKDPVIPRHIAFIPDGNRRWALQKGLSFGDGHRAGAQNFVSILKYCLKLGIPYITFYAFSSENWQRPPKEKNFLFSLLSEYLNQKREDFVEQVNVRFIGDTKDFPDFVCEGIENLQKRVVDKGGTTLQIALGYGGRDEIVRSVQKIYHLIERGEIAVKDVNATLLGKYLDTGGLPDPDLLIRSGGDQRVSNFLLFQMAYTEFFFTPTLWPDFSIRELDQALLDFSKRDRRFGKKSFDDHQFLDDGK